MLFWHGFNDALWGHSSNDSRNPVISAIEQSIKLSLRPLPPSRHHHHVQIKKLTKRCGICLRDNHVNYQHSSILHHRFTTICKDLKGVMVIPIVDNTAQQVDVRSFWNRLKEIPHDIRASPPVTQVIC